MKHLNLFFAYLMGLVIGFNLYSCKNEEVEPPVVTPSFEVQNELGEVFNNALKPSYLGGEYQLVVKSTCKWEAQVTCEGGWITLDPTSADGSKTCVMTISANDAEDTTVGRTGKVTFIPADESLTPFEITITQSFKPFNQEAYFISPEGAGTKDGTTWENAMDFAGFRTLLSQDGVSTYPVYMMEGTYKSTGQITPRKNIKLISGGYSSSSTGIDITNKSSNPTIISGENLSRIINIEQINARIENIEFANGKSVSGNYDWGIGVFIYVLDENTVELVNCVVRDCSSDGNANEGAAITVHGTGTVKLDNVAIYNNKSKTQGGGIHVTSSSALRLFMNNCTLSANTVRDDDWCWGVAFQVNVGEDLSHVYMNNTTIFAKAFLNTGNARNVLNSDCPVIAINSTFVGAENNDNVVRVNNSKGTTGFINCLFVNNGGTGKSLSHADQSSILSLGWNVHQGFDFEAKSTDTDASEWTFDDLRNEDGVYKWNVDGQLQNFAKTSDIINTLSEIEGCQDFIEWIGGEDGLSKDQLGNSRNPEKLQPGAYDATLN